MDLVARILGLFDGRGKLKLAGLACLMAVGALLELVGLGLVMPVVAMLAEPSLLAQNKYLHAIHSALGSVSDSHFLLLLCFLVAFAYLFHKRSSLFSRNCRPILCTRTR
jgi:ABC-type methionine transport system permease subunit